MPTYEGTVDGAGMRVGIVVARFNELITRNLLDGARDALRRGGVADDDVTVAWVPGSFEIPLVAKTMACSGRYDAVVCLGAVIRGATAHFDHVAGQAASGVARAGLDTGVPVIFGILTTDTIDQALERVGAKGTNRGADAAFAALEMASLLRQLKAPSQ
ncbi:MAG TPA: 6,7-dimethyl-8-ribityllumazine synthase [Chloroflexota bacterium]|nr:6,7-dimethyl-8-ribityllumazine synthase [Chloroflexota bacterium]